MKQTLRDGTDNGKRTAIMVTSHAGQPSCGELEMMAAAGERPRKDYIELARLLDAEVIDAHYMAERATPLAQMVAHWVGLPPGQVVEVFLRRGHYRSIVAWADRLGLSLALLFKLARSRRDLVLISVWLSDAKKAFLVRHLKVYTHLGAIVNYGSVQMEVAAARLGVPRHKLYLGLSPVDDRFWYPRPVPTENLICAVGSEQRDYPTLIRAVEGLELEVELAVGTVVLSSAAAATGEVAAQMRRISGQGLPGNVRLSRLSPRELRDLYARSLFVVIPLKDVDYDAGVTAVVEAMAMGKAVIVSRTRGQVDVIRDGEQGIYVPPGDSVALRAAIEYLASHPAEAERMGRAGRRLVEERHTLDLYVARLAALVRGLATEDTVIPRPMPSEG